MSRGVWFRPMILRQRGKTIPVDMLHVIGYTGSMDHVLRSIVYRVAEDTRWDIESKAQYSDCPQHDKETLCGWCAIAAAELHKNLSREGIAAVIVMWQDPYSVNAHCYIKVDDYVVDITATQFQEYRDVPVLILHEREAEVNEYHTGLIEFSCTKALRNHQKRELWPSSQIAFA